MDQLRPYLGPTDIHGAAHQFKPERLTLARDLRGLSKVELAERVDCSPSAVTQFESGDIKPDHRTLGRIALALAFPVQFFAMPMPSPGGLLSVEDCNFRKLRSATQRERRRVLAVGTLIRDFTNVLEKLVNIPEEQVSRVAEAHSQDADIESLAVKVRKEWGLGLGPIPDLVKLLESKGIIVAVIPDDSRAVDAFSAWHAGRPMVFLLSGKESTSRTRFTAAHELGHLIMHADVNPGDPELERQANRFAGAFLFPKEPFLQECPRGLEWDHYFELKRRWRLSVAALVRRAYDLGQLSDASYRRACIHLNKYNHIDEPHDPPVELPQIITQSVRLLRGQLPIEELSAQIGLRVTDLESIVDLKSF